MLKNFINYHFVHHLKQTAACISAGLLPKYALALDTSTQIYLLNFKPDEIKPDEQVVDPQERPAYYNVDDEEEYPEDLNKSHHELPEEHNNPEQFERERKPRSEQKNESFSKEREKRQ